MIGKRINGRYQILETIGGGGMANVYKAHDAILNRTVAVKVLRPQFSDDEEFIRRFRREAQAATSLSHPNVVNIYDVGEEADLYYIVMEYVAGLTLKQLIQQRGSLPISEIIGIMSQISSAIAHAHANHIVHRDIKPHNILISESGEAKVTDFGIARAMTSATITHTNSVMGSVHYLSPEQARGGLVNEKSDIYSLGIVLYEMVTGRVPFSGDTAVSIAIKHLQTEVPSPRKTNPTLPQSVENIILKATAKDPFHRYTSVRELEEDLHTALDPRRINEEKFVIPDDNEDVTKAIPIIKEDLFADDNLEQTKIKTQNEQKPNQSDEDKPKKKRKWVMITFITFFLLVGSVIAAFAIIPKLLHVDEVLIPADLIGMEYDEVFETLTTLGLLVEREDQNHGEIPEGHVISTNPEAGRTVKVNTTITVFVSEGKPKIEMVDVTSLDKEIARKTLIRLGFKEENIQEATEESDIEEDKVIRQTPLPDELIVPEETIVTLTYSIPKWFSLQNLTGLPSEEVRDYLTKHGLIMKSHYEFSDHVPEGRVIEQSPPGFRLVQKGTEVIVVFSKGPEPQPEPEPISTIVNKEAPVSPEDQLANIGYPIKITYRDSLNKEHVVFIEEFIQKTKIYDIPVTINPGDYAEVILYIEGEQYGNTDIYRYDDVKEN
ncbi:Stk1 family PASTA domain-containing Ser/Thr kinase [Anaerobacillus alkaliphilus]|uniref:Serine/threonine-protein kinase PrkC n=1 Tax=Anaerobacillus alkaliphilus TaxID=1548597 RepID=A0A4Q0VQ74_9BACI|nr:Stk1 family PASTA domain-containing Ser/Thr kinase [Anaerobacillus alkaliphilus]RXI98057.1 Stk1 family PASTA domain-containing Ser/Thr kinase [Anaerobacillus alkaliphilus]